MVLVMCFILLVMEDKVLYCFIYFGVSLSTFQLSMTSVCLLVSQTHSEYYCSIITLQHLVKDNIKVTKLIEPNLILFTFQAD